MKRLISLILALVMCFSLSTAALADFSDAPGSEAQTEETGKPEPSRPEETKWYYRITEDGLVQRRLWSLTYGYWKTDWITIGYV